MMSPEIEEAMIDLRKFMFENVYKNPVAKGRGSQGEGDDRAALFTFYKEHLDQLPAKYLRMMDEGRARICGRGLHRRNDGSVCHHQVFGVLFLPQPGRWTAIKTVSCLRRPRAWQVDGY